MAFFVLSEQSSFFFASLLEEMSVFLFPVEFNMAENFCFLGSRCPYYLIWTIDNNMSILRPYLCEEYYG
jgi:hypothetical protein